MRLAGEGHLSALLLCFVKAEDFFSCCSARPCKEGVCLCLLACPPPGVRGRGTEAPVRALTPGLLTQAEKPRLAQQVTGNFGKSLCSKRKSSPFNCPCHGRCLYLIDCFSHE